MKRDVETLASDLVGFLDCIGSYLPFDYVSDKLKSESTNIQTVWNIIYEFYDAELSTTNYMDYATMTREPNETYRNYYNRLVGFVRQHLPATALEAEGVQSPAGGENLTIALLDSVAIHWLLSIDKRLIGIVRTEFATDLKTKRLSQMIKQISKNIDELLVRYENKDQISVIQTKQSSFDSTVPTENNNLPAYDLLVRRIEK